MNAKLFAHIILAMLLGIALIFVLSKVQQCTRSEKFHPPLVKVRTVHHHHVSHVVKHDTLLIKSKPKIIYRSLNSPPSQGGVPEGGGGSSRGGYTIAHDTIHFRGNTLAITDTIQGDTITARWTNIIQSDTTTTITNTDTVFIEKTIQPKPKRFSVNLSGGYGYTIGSPVPAPQIGITVGLKLWSF